MSSSSTLSNHVLETYSDYHASGEVIPVNGCSQCKKKILSHIKMNNLDRRSKCTSEWP